MIKGGGNINNDVANAYGKGGVIGGG